MIDQSKQSSLSRSSYLVTKLEALKEVAPNFTLITIPNQTVSLKDFLGSPVIWAFYPADFSPVYGDEMSLYNEILP